MRESKNNVVPSRLSTCQQKLTPLSVRNPLPPSAHSVAPLSEFSPLVLSVPPFFFCRSFFRRCLPRLYSFRGNCFVERCYWSETGGRGEREEAQAENFFSCIYKNIASLCRMMILVSARYSLAPMIMNDFTHEEEKRHNSRFALSVCICF